MEPSESDSILAVVIRPFGLYEWWISSDSLGGLGSDGTRLRET
jgi:hypothetical protein